MGSESVLILEGSLFSDGTIRLDRPPDVPPGRVRITLQAISASMPERVQLPDGPWPDDAVPPPFDLPLPGTPQRVSPRKACELLPDLLRGTEEQLG